MNNKKLEGNIITKYWLKERAVNIVFILTLPLFCLYMFIAWLIVINYFFLVHFARLIDWITNIEIVERLLE